MFLRKVCFVTLFVGLAVLNTTAAVDSSFFVFLAFGQSNMEGFPGTIQAEDTINVPTRFQLLPAADSPNKGRPKGVWATAFSPLCRSDGPGLCPCDYFGRTLVDSLPANVKIGIINVSLAGCCIEMFDKDKYQAYINTLATDNYLRSYAIKYGGNPYARMVEMCKTAQNAGVIKGFLLHQGESGTGVAGDVWTTEVKKIYSDLIKDLSLDSNKVPLLVGGLTDDSKNNSNSSLPWSLVKPTRLISNCYVVSSIGCAANLNDGFGGLHFSSAGYRELGKHYADSMLVAFKKLGTGPTPIIEKQTRTSVGVANRLGLTAAASSISFELSQRANVILSAYALSGTQIAILAKGDFSAGKHTIFLSPKALLPGVVVIKMKAGTSFASRTMLVQGN